MQIVIDIPNEKSEKLIKQMKLDRNFRECKIIELSKGHGRLIDADVLVDGMEDDYDFCEVVNATPTIIEADKESEVEVITRGKCVMCGKELTEGLFFCKECGDKANSEK